MFRRALRPFVRNDPVELLRTVAADPAIVYRHFAGTPTRPLPEHADEVPPTPSQVRDAVGDLFPSVPRDRRLDRWLELHDDRTFYADVASRLRATASGPDRPYPNWREFLYLLVRHARPSVVVETGVRGGLSSAYLLAALERNGRGRLVSIDVGDRSVVPDDVTPREVGWLVPDRLRSQWELRIGDSEDLLPAVLSERDAGILLSDVPNSVLDAELSVAKRELAPGSLVVSCYPLGSDAERIWREHTAAGVDARAVGQRWVSDAGESEVGVGVVGSPVPDRPD